MSLSSEDLDRIEREAKIAGPLLGQYYWPRDILALVAEVKRLRVGKPTVFGTLTIGSTKEAQALREAHGAPPPLDTGRWEAVDLGLNPRNERTWSLPDNGSSLVVYPVGGWYAEFDCAEPDDLEAAARIVRAASTGPHEHVWVATGEFHASAVPKWFVVCECGAAGLWQHEGPRPTGPLPSGAVVQIKAVGKEQDHG